VSRDKSPAGHFRCNVTLLNRHLFYVGTFVNEEEAARAYDLACVACGRTAEHPNKVRLDPTRECYVINRVHESLAKVGIELRPEHI